METTKGSFHISDKIMAEQILNSFWELPPIDRLVDLAKSYYDSGEIISADYLNWQYADNPNGYPVFTLVEKENEIIGQYIVIPMKYLIRGKETLGSLSLNTLVHPDHHGKGLFTKMAKETYQKCDQIKVKMTLGFPNPLSHNGFTKKLEFSQIGNGKLLICPLKPMKMFFQTLKKNKQKHGGDLDFNFEEIRLANTKLISLNEDHEILYDHFWKGLDLTKNTTLKNFAFIKWRYFDIPGRNYHVIGSVTNGVLTSACAIRIEKVMNLDSAIIMDFFVQSNSIQDGRTLLRELKKQLKKKGISMITCLEPNEEITREIIKKTGFFRVPNKFLPQPIPIILKTHGTFEEEGLFDNNEWSFSFGDYDIF